MLSSLTLTRVRPLLVAIGLAGAIVACEQNFESGFACPALCPQQADSLRDTTFYAVEFDTSVSGYPTTGSEAVLMLTNDPAVDLRGVVRFDTLQSTFRHKNTTADSQLTAVASVVMKLLIAKADTLGPPVTFELYDIDGDTTQDDTASAVLTPRFDPLTVLGTRTVPADSLKDSVLVSIDTAKFMEKIRSPGGGRLRVGIRIAAPALTQVKIFTTNGGFSPHLFIRPSLDSTVDSITIAPFSRSPSSNQQLAIELGDFQLVSASPLLPTIDVFRVGGAPAHRAYLRFNIPSQILDSSAVIRATLVLTQRADPGAPEASDTAGVVPFELAAGSSITDLKRVLIFLISGLDSVGMAPKDGGERSFEMITAVRRWQFTNPDRTPRAIALRANREGTSPWRADFYSQRTATVGFRPRLHITYIPQHKGGLP
jgi:hypothetical protein